MRGWIRACGVAGSLLLAMACPLPAQTNSDSGDNRGPQRVQMPIEIIPASFLHQISADDFEESLAYSAGLITGSVPWVSRDFIRLGLPQINPVETRDFSPSNSGGAWGYLGRNRDNAIAVRGFTNQTQQRLGFRVGASFGDGRSIGNLIDTANIERLEVVRGPAGLFYGINVLSGVVNVVPKMPLSSFASSLDLTVGSYGYHRLVADATGPITDGLEYRFIGVLQQEDDQIDFAGEERDYFAAQFEYQPFASTHLFFEYQHMDQHFQGIGPRRIYADIDDALPRNRFGEPIDWAQRAGVDEADFNWSGPDTRFDRETDSFILKLEQDLTDSLRLTFGANWNFTEEYTRNLYVDTYAAQELPAAAQGLGTRFDDGRLRVLRGAFYEDARELESAQFRAELNYDFDLGETRHSVLVGYSDIKDNIEEWGVDPARNELTITHYKAVDDLTPFRFAGETAVYRDEPFNFFNGPDVVQTDDFWVEGYYGVYRGSFFRERLQLFFGGRNDQFRAREVRRDRLENGEPGEIITATSRREFGPLRSPDGFRYGGETLDFSTVNIGASFRLNENLTVYALRAEGLNPNPGQIDGFGELFPEEKTVSQELGAQFDLLEGRLYGSVSVYSIHRDNAVWSQWPVAPAPWRWETFTDIDPSPDVPIAFDPESAANGFAPLSYGVRRDFFTPEQIARLPNGEFVNPAVLEVTGDYVYVIYEQLDAGALRGPVEAAFNSPDEDAFSYQARLVDGRLLGNNPDSFSGGNVQFEEEAEGVDVQLVLTPLYNWQIQLNYAYTRREATAFNPVDYIDLATGRDWSTEFNQVRRVVGDEAMGDPLRPATINDGLLLGQDYGFAPPHELTIWSNYRVVTGMLSGLDVGVGFIYTGPRPTSVRVGDDELANNRFPTPDTKEVAFINLAFGYKTSLWGRVWDFRLNINNLLDTTRTESTAIYTGPDGETVERRAVQHFMPLNLRLSASVRF